MKRFLKYLLSAIVAFVFWNCTDIPVSAVSEDSSATMSLVETESQTTISESESVLCLPRQDSFANSYRSQTTARRTVSEGRSNIEFAKSGKVINAEIRYSVQRNSILIHSTLIEPNHRLLSLGKLII